MSGIQPSDFVGYLTGKPSVSAGFHGLLDFIGFPVGMAPVAISAGFVGLLDFAGFPVGAAVAAAIEKVKLVRGPLPTRKRKRKHDDEEELLLLI